MNTRVEPLRAGLAILTTLGLVIAMMMVFSGAPAFGHVGGAGDTCPEDEEGWSQHFDDSTQTVSGDFGSITMTGAEDEDDELLTASINEGYEVEICVKQADSHEHFFVTSENDGIVHSGDLSHWSYRVVQEPEPSTVTFVKDWDMPDDMADPTYTITFNYEIDEEAGDPVGENVEVLLPFGSTLDTVEETLEVTLPDECDVTDSVVSPTSVTADDPAGEAFTITVTNTVTCEEEDTPPPPGEGSIEVTKTAGAESVVSGSEVTFTVEVENTSDVAVTIDSITDSEFGEIAPTASGDIVSTDCSVPQDLAASDGTAGSGDDYYSCEFVAVVEGEFGTPHVNTVTASGVDVNDNPVSDSDDASVGFDEVLTLTPLTPTTAGPVTPVQDEVLDTTVEAEQLPFTGIDTPLLLGLAIMLLGSGALVLRLTGRREES